MESSRQSKLIAPCYKCVQPMQQGTVPNFILSRVLSLTIYSPFSYFQNISIRVPLKLEKYLKHSGLKFNLV